MKQIIVLLGMICLGIFIFNIIASDNANSVKTATGTFWEKQIEYYNNNNPDL